MDVFQPQKTFRPKYIFARTVKLQEQIIHQAENDSGPMRDQTQCPLEQDFNEWLAAHAVEYFNEANIIFGNLVDICTNESCHLMSAGPKYQYLWADGVHVKQPIKCSAPEYVSFLMDWIHVQFEDPSLFPQDQSESYPEEFGTVVKNIFKRLFRVYSHIYYSHYKELEKSDAVTYLNASFRRFIFFVKEHGLVGERELKPLSLLIQNLEESERILIKRFSSSKSQGRRGSRRRSSVELTSSQSSLKSKKTRESIKEETSKDNEKDKEEAPETLKDILKDDIEPPGEYPYLDRQSKATTLKPTGSKTDRLLELKPMTMSSKTSLRRVKIQLPDLHDNFLENEGSKLPELPEKNLEHEVSEESKEIKDNEEVDDELDELDKVQPLASEIETESATSLGDDSDYYFTLDNNHHGRRAFKSVYLDVNKCGTLSSAELQSYLVEPPSDTPPMPNSFEQRHDHPTNLLGSTELSLESIEQSPPFTADKVPPPPPPILTSIDEVKDMPSSPPPVKPGAQFTELDELPIAQVILSPRTPTREDTFRKNGTLPISLGIDLNKLYAEVESFAPDEIAASVKPEDRVSRVGIIGFGFDSKFLVGQLRKSGFKIAFLCDDRSEVHEMAKEMGIEESYEDVMSVLKIDTSLYDMVYVSADAFEKGREITLVDMIRFAKKNHRHLCVSPLALTLHQRRDLVGVTSTTVSKPRFVNGMFPLRQLKGISIMKEKLKQEVMGKPRHISLNLKANLSALAQKYEHDDNAAYLNYLMSSMQMSLFDLASWLMDGTTIHSVNSNYHLLNKGDKEKSADFVSISFETENNIVGHLTISFVENLVVFVNCTGGSITYHNEKVEVQKGDNLALIETECISSDVSEDWDLLSGAAQAYCESMVEMLASQSPTDSSNDLCSIMDVYKSIRVMEAIRRQRMLNQSSFTLIAELLRTSTKTIKMMNNQTAALPPALPSFSQDKENRRATLATPVNITSISSRPTTGVDQRTRSFYAQNGLQFSQ